jgi:hypothetical protein
MEEITKIEKLYFYKGIVYIYIYILFFGVLFELSKLLLLINFNAYVLPIAHSVLLIISLTLFFTFKTIPNIKEWKMLIIFISVIVLKSFISNSVINWTSFLFNDYDFNIDDIVKTIHNQFFVYSYSFIGANSILLILISILKHYKINPSKQKELNYIETEKSDEKQ